MADAFSLVLWSLAEYFNYTAVALVILCSTLMTIFIIRLNGEHWGNYHNGINRAGASLAQQKEVEQFVNPFYLRLDPSVTSTLSDGLALQMSCLQPCVVHVFWGTTINPVHAALLKPGREFVDYVSRGSPLLDQCLAADIQSFEEAGRHTLHLTAPDGVSAESLGSLPRQRYPCVIVMTVKDSSSIMDHTTVVATVTVVHLKDSQCQMQTHILAQYAKMAGHAVYNLQPLFLASAMDEDGSAEEPGDLHSADCHLSSRPTLSSNRNDTDSKTLQPQGETETSTQQEDEDSVHAEASSCEHDLDSCPLPERPSPRSCTRSLGQNSTSQDEGACGDCDRDAHSLYSSFQERESRYETAFPECIVCQNQPLNCALLPCRHTCVCSSCFQKLDRCPMCRSPVESYFNLRDDDDYGESAEPILPEEVQALPRDLYGMFELWNTRLNRYLGFE